MTSIDQLLSKSSDHYRFHGVRAQTLSQLISQSENSEILLWGTDEDEHITEDFEEAEYVQGEGFLYVTDIRNIQMSYSEFCDDGGLVLVLEKSVEKPFEFEHPTDRRQFIIKVQEWKVVGGLRPVEVDEDGDVVEEEAFSLEDILSENF